MEDDILFPIEDNTNTRIEALKAPKNAQNDTLLMEKRLNEPNPNIIEKVAPSDAPEEIPKIYGSARGF